MKPRCEVCQERLEKRSGYLRNGHWIVCGPRCAERFEHIWPEDAPADAWTWRANKPRILETVK